MQLATVIVVLPTFMPEMRSKRNNLFKLILLLLVTITSTLAFSQKTEGEDGKYYTLEAASVNPEKVVELHLVRKKLRVIPDTVFTFTSLKVLDLHNNKLTQLDPRIMNLVNLISLALSKNKLNTLPDETGSLHKLQKLILNRNSITGLPPSIGKLKSLEYLDLWDNYLSAFPDEAAKLKNLKELDMRGNSMTREEQESVQKLFPNARILFSQYCNCKPHINK